MPTETMAAEQTWRYLWSHAAHDIIASSPSIADLERIQVGLGWGLRSRSNKWALLLYPSSNGRTVGDLALTVLGQGTQSIPRCSYSYAEYLDAVADIIETTAQAYLDAADDGR